MYVKYRVFGCGDHVREVKHFAIRAAECTGEGGAIINGAEIYDAGFETVADMADIFAEYLASLVVEDVRQVEAMRQPDRNPVVSVWGAYGNDYSDEADIKWFSSREAAEKVMVALCDELAHGGQFFDMTAYDENGDVVYG